jgi:hypothetical protein
MKISAIGECRNETKSYRRRRVMKISTVVEGAEWKLALSPTALKELHYALPWLLMGQIQKNKKGLFRPKNHLTLLSL